MQEVLVAGGTIVGYKLVEYLWDKFIKRAVDTDYVTTEDCSRCEKHAEDEASVEDMRRELRNVKSILLIIADKQGIKPTELSAIMN